MNNKQLVTEKFEFSSFCCLKKRHHSVHLEYCHLRELREWENLPWSYVPHLVDLGFLSLSSLGSWGITVWTVMLTVVICCFGVTYDQQLLDVPLPRNKHGYLAYSNTHTSRARFTQDIVFFIFKYLRRKITYISMLKAVL